MRRIQVCSNNGPGPLQRRDNNKIAKIRWDLLKIFPGTIGSEKLKIT
jgi:hypothetical protein